MSGIVTDVERPQGHSTPGSGKGRKALRWAVAPVLTAVAVSASTVVVGPRLGGADQISDAKAKAAELQSQIQATGQQIDALSQQYNAAQIKKQQVDGQIQATENQIAQTKAEIGSDQGTLRKAAVNAYVSAGSSTQDPLFTGDQTQQAAATVYTHVAQGDVSTAVDNLNIAQNQLDVQEATLQTQDQEAAAAVSAANQAYQQAQTLQAQQQATLSQVNSQIQQLIEQQQAAELAAAQAAAQQKAQEAAAQQAAAQQQAATTAVRAGGGGGGGGGGAAPTVTQAVVPANTAGGRAVQAAESQIGVPYVYAAESPGVGFDCSGLTAWAWGQAGVSLPHFSGAQMAASTPVPLSQLEPGDLLFYGPGGGDHVAMYVGPGEMIEAPYTGATVTVTALRTGNDFAGAGRP